MTDQPRIKALLDEMDHDAKDPALGAKELRARLRYYRRQFIEALREEFK